MSASPLIRVARAIYRKADGKVFFHSVRLPGKQFPTKRKLVATNLRAAIAEVETLNTRRREARLGVGLDPYRSLATVGQLAAAWLAARCPDRHGRPRAGLQLEAETQRLNRALPFWRDRAVLEIVAFEDGPDYHTWRTAQARGQFRLDRSVDAELMTLANLFQWAVMNPRRTGLKYNPLASRPRFEDRRRIRHCTAVMPASDEQFHQVAAWLLSADRTRALGWQFLLEGLTGARTSEILGCRLDAQARPNDEGDPGWFDAWKLHIKPAKDRLNPFAPLEVVKGHDPLRDCLGAFLHWHETRHPDSPWFIPGRDPRRPAERNSLTHALVRASRALGVPKLTSHGLRAYFVHTLRSLGVTDNEIAARLGHRSVQQIEDTYGKVKATWFGNGQQDFLPEDCAPAWAGWQPATAYQKLIVPNPKLSKPIQPDANGAGEKKPAGVAKSNEIGNSARNPGMA